MTLRPWHLLIAGAALLLGPTSAVAAQPAYKPELFQKGKDVVWVPSSEALVNRMLDMVALRPDDYLVDLGSGDGITVILAAKRGARAHGIEFNPELVALAKRNASQAGVAARATFVQGDIFESNFSSATVVALFLLPELNLRLRPILLKMKPGTRVVSNTFDMGDWKPDQSVPRQPDCESFCTAYAWTVPAPVEGVWTLGDRELVLTQSFQLFEGNLRNGGDTQALSEGRMHGRQIFFTLGDERYVGEVQGDVMEGTRASGSSWRATRRR
jgi:precorrin-6B methylase 2